MMDHEEFRRALSTLEVSQRQFAQKTNTDVTLIKKWANGKAEIPGIAEAYVRLRLAIHHWRNR